PPRLTPLPDPITAWRANLLPTLLPARELALPPAPLLPSTPVQPGRRILPSSARQRRSRDPRRRGPGARLRAPRSSTLDWVHSARKGEQARELALAYSSRAAARRDGQGSKVGSSSGGGQRRS